MNLETIELKAFVPAIDFGLGKRFYRDLGFNIPWSSEELAYLYAGNCSFLLQNTHGRAIAEPFTLHLLVEDVASWWQLVEEHRLAERYGVRAEPPGDRPWGVREFVLDDPSGVEWRIGTSIAQIER